MIADLCKKHDVLVFADEVYEWLIYKPNKHIKIGKNVIFTEAIFSFEMLIKMEYIMIT